MGGTTLAFLIYQDGEWKQFSFRAYDYAGLNSAHNAINVPWDEAILLGVDGGRIAPVRFTKQVVVIS